MSLINVLLFRCDVLSDIFRHLIFCHVQIVCPICSLYVASDRFDAHRLAHRRSETSRETTPSFNITVNPSTFDSFFNHEHSRGERLTLIQRSTILQPWTKVVVAPHLILDKGASCIQAEALLSSSHQHQPVSRVPRFDRFGIARSSREKMLAKRAYFSLFDRQLIRNSMSRSTGQRAVNFSS